MRLRRFVSLSFLALLLSARVCAQSPSGTISGLVLDPSGAIVVGADILAANDATGVQYAAKTNGNGIYLVSSLPPGTYRLQVSKAGFKTLIKPDIVLSIEDALAINFTLPVGAISEIVTVSAGVPMVNTTDGSVSTVVDQNYVKNMPLNGRSFQDLILLTPGAVTATPQSTNVSILGGTGEFSVNGQRTQSNYYTVDGVSANVGTAPGTTMTGSAGASGSVASVTALGTTQALVSVDDLEEFRIQSSSYSAEYGRESGGQFAFETKSGTNQWHGTAYDYLRNGAFDANDWFNDYLHVSQPALRQNDFGGTLGGPIEVPGLYNGRDKTFFFFSYEGLRLTQPTEATISYVPDSTLRANTPQPLEQVLDAFPVPNCTSTTPNCTNPGGGWAGFIGSWSNPSSLDSTSIRFDHAVNEKLKLFFRFSDTPSDQAIRESGALVTPTEYNTLSYLSRTYTAGASSTLTNRISDEFRINYSSNQVTNSQRIVAFGGSTPVDLAQLAGTGPNSAPVVVIDYAGHEILFRQFRQAGIQKQWNLVDAVSWSLGPHQLKAGVDYRRLTPTAAPYNPLDEYIYFSEAQVESNTTLESVAEANAQAFPLYLNFSAFVQDEWQLRPRLNLSLGVRWDVNPAPGVAQGIKPYTVEGNSVANYALAAQGTPLWATKWTNLAPRLGAVYILRQNPDSELVLRGGFGVFYDSGQQLGSLGYGGPGFSALQIFPGSAFPLAPTNSTPAIVNPPSSPYSAAVVAFPSGLQVPYTLQWNASLEQAFGKSQALTVSYVAAHSARLLETNEISGSAIANPAFRTFGLELIQNGLTSDYDALELQFKRRLTQGLSALASYTWSHCIDYGTQYISLPYLRGNCDFDVRHNLSAAFSYDVPYSTKSKILGSLFRHWGLDDRFTARTSFPVTLQGSTAVDSSTGAAYYAGLNVVADEPLYLYGSAYPGGREVNPAAFALPASGQPGNAPRNFVRGFGAWQNDFAFRRDFPIHENLRLQFRAEAFNVFNHPNFGNINSTYCGGGAGCTFGQATGTLAKTLGILNPLYQQGGPRSLQLALKLTF